MGEGGCTIPIGTIIKGKKITQVLCGKKVVARIGIWDVCEEHKCHAMFHTTNASLNNDDDRKEE